MKKQYFEPNKGDANNYMLDTSAYNYIAKRIEMLNVVKKALSYGFCYYSTAVQDRELSGEGAKTYDNRCISVQMKSVAPELLEKFSYIDEELNVKLVPEVASGMRDHTRVDGTNRFCSPQSLEGIVRKEISKKIKLIVADHLRIAMMQ